ncbi:hypothetical protein GCM10023214_54160 [Amycolatopsis dongchuanensis]|uniref:Uncharacterized protein n=1 Tax=Amycolatopsis dongchuanensis TaxID=1070866 RepID=A0ABP9R7U8_9PSEU
MPVPTPPPADTRAQTADTRTPPADTRAQTADTRTQTADTRARIADTPEIGLGLRPRRVRT